MALFYALQLSVFKVTEWLENIVFTSLEKGLVQAFDFVILSSPIESKSDLLDSQSVGDNINYEEYPVLEVFKFNFHHVGRRDHACKSSSSSIIEQVQTFFSSLLTLLSERRQQRRQNKRKVSINFVMETKNASACKVSNRNYTQSNGDTGKSQLQNEDDKNDTSISWPINPLQKILSELNVHPLLSSKQVETQEDSQTNSIHNEDNDVIEEHHRYACSSTRILNDFPSVISRAISVGNNDGSFEYLAQESRKLKVVF